MRVLVIGASGFIGRHLVRHLAGARRHTVAGTFWSRPPANDDNSWHRVELTDRLELERVFRMAQPEAVVHLAAVADVGAAERDRQRASAVNVDGTSLVAQLCQLHQARLVYVSTEYVFPGAPGYYSEDATPDPTTHYGRTKWEAEQRVAELCSRWSVLRTSIVYGWPEPGQRNFGPRLIETLRNGQPYHARTDVYRTPVYVVHLVEGIAALTTGDYQGTYHVAGKDWVSMYHFAHAIAQAFDLDTDLVAPSGSQSEKSGVGVSGQPEPAGASDLLGLDSTHTINVLGLQHYGLADGIKAFRAGAPHF